MPSPAPSTVFSTSPRALLVNALDEEVALFWRKQGFLASVDDPFIPDRSMSDIAASLSSVGAKT